MTKFWAGFSFLLFTLNAHADTGSRTLLNNPGRVICDYFRDVLESKDPKISYSIGYTKLEVPDCAAEMPEVNVEYDAFEEMDFKNCASAGWASQSGNMWTHAGFDGKNSHVHYGASGDLCEMVHGGGFDGYASVHHVNGLDSVLTGPSVSATVTKNALKLTVAGLGRFRFDVNFRSSPPVDHPFSLQYSLALIEIGSEPTRIYNHFWLGDEAGKWSLIDKETWR